MPNIEPRDLADLLGLKPKQPRRFTSLDLAALVMRGLPVKAVDRVCYLIAPGDAKLRYSVVPKATLTRRQRTVDQRLSPEESDRVARLARIWAFALEIWGSAEEAQRFLAEPHPLLGGRIPRVVTIETEIGARAVEDLLGRLKYGSAA